MRNDNPVDFGSAGCVRRTRTSLFYAVIEAALYEAAPSAHGGSLVRFEGLHF